MPPSTAGLRAARVWKTNANINMPTPVINQPMSSGPGATLPAICDGRAKIPLPIIDPMTMAVSAASERPGRGRDEPRPCSSPTSSFPSTDCVILRPLAHVRLAGKPPLWPG